MVKDLKRAEFKDSFGRLLLLTDGLAWVDTRRTGIGSLDLLFAGNIVEEYFGSKQRVVYIK